MLIWSRARILPVTGVFTATPKSEMDDGLVLDTSVNANVLEEICPRPPRQSTVKAAMRIFSGHLQVVPV